MSFAEKMAANRAARLPTAAPLAPATPAAWGAAPVARFEAPARRHGVSDSPDLARILALHRRPPVDLLIKPDGTYSVEAQALVNTMTERFRRDRKGSPCACASMGRHCIEALLPAQAWTLYEAPKVGGAFGAVGVGHGKTALDLLAAMAFADTPQGCKLAVLFVPPGLRYQLVSEYLLWSEHFNLPSLVIDGKGYIKAGRPVVHVVPYSMLSRPESTALLNSLKPDLFLADECHRFSKLDGSGAFRFASYCAEHATRFAGWSGTVTSDKVEDYAHLLAFALGDGSPLPLEPPVVAEWGTALNPSSFPAGAGALAALCGPGESLYAGYSRRLAETVGVITTVGSSIAASMTINEREPAPMSAKLAEELEKFRKGGVRPDGEELLDELEIAACARQLACGFFYRWRFPGIPKEEGREREAYIAQIEAWFAARKAYRSELRDRLLAARQPNAPREHLDSPHLLENAAERYHRETFGKDPYEGPLPLWDSLHYPAWFEIKDSIPHETEAVWIDDYLVKDAAAWGKKHKGVIWYEYAEFGAKIAELSGLPQFGPGKDAVERLKLEKGNRSIVCSIGSHGEGRDGLQRIFWNQLVANPPSSGKKWEQLLGRLVRVGQKKHEVTADVYRHTPEMAQAIDRAVLKARYIGGTTRNAQIILSATCSFPLVAGPQV